MINEIKTHIASNARHLGYEHIDQDLLSFTKFCQRIVEEHTKVLFLVTYKGKELCIVKTVRDSSYNERLQNEADTQRELSTQGIQHVPSVLIEGKIKEVYFYAEPVASGVTPSRGRAKKLEKEILEFVASLPTAGTCSSSTVHKALEALTVEDEVLKHLIEMFGTYDVSLKRGVTHSDLGRPNILIDKNSFVVIDWERASDLPFWMIDGVYFIMKVHNIHSRAVWRSKGFSILQNYVSIDQTEAEALYILAAIAQRLKKKYANDYRTFVSNLKNYL